MAAPEFPVTSSQPSTAFAYKGFVEVAWEEPLEPWVWNDRVTRVAAKGAPPEEN